MMTEITHEIKIKAIPEQVFDAIATPDGMRSWHTALVEGTGEMGSVWNLKFAGHPDFSWHIVTSQAPAHVAWECVDGPGDSVGTTVDYRISATDDGRTLLEFTHAGWPNTAGSFRKCNTLWGALMHQLQQYVETGRSAPAFR